MEQLVCHDVALLQSTTLGWIWCTACPMVQGAFTTGFECTNTVLGTGPGAQYRPTSFLVKRYGHNGQNAPSNSVLCNLVSLSQCSCMHMLDASLVTCHISLTPPLSTAAGVDDRECVCAALLEMCAMLGSPQLVCTPAFVCVTLPSVCAFARLSLRLMHHAWL